MTVDYSPTPPVSGVARNTAPTETQLWTDYSDTVGDVDDRLVAVENATTALVVALGDETTALSTGVSVVTFRMPYAMTLTGVRASLTTASSSGVPTFDINENGTSILSTKLTVDAGERTSTTATTAPVISDPALADDAEITVDVDVAGTGATGAKITLIGTRA